MRILRSQPSLDFLGIMSANPMSLRQSARSMSRVVYVAILLSFTWCTNLKLCSQDVSLEKIPIKSMEAHLVHGPAMAPGETSPLIVRITEPNGKVLKLDGREKGPRRFMWNDLKIESNILTTDLKGYISLQKNPRISDGKLPHLTVTVPSHPGLHAELDIPVRYDRPFVANFSGHRGRDSAMGDDGEDAPPVLVRMTFRPGSRPRLQVSVSDGCREDLFLVDPHGGSLTVKAEGGLGGWGWGVTGGMEGPTPSSDPLWEIGWEGRRGKDGSITVTYDPKAKPFLSILHLFKGNGPPLEYIEEPVAPLW